MYCTLTNCRLITSLLKLPDLGMTGSLCLVSGYWQPLVHSHCSLACLLWFHKQREWMTYILLWGRGSHLVGGPAGRLARNDKVFMCGTIKGLTTDWILEAYFRGTSHMLRMLFLAINFSAAVFLGVDCLLVNTALWWCEKANVWGKYSVD